MRAGHLLALVAPGAIPPGCAAQRGRDWWRCDGARARAGQTPVAPPLAAAAARERPIGRQECLLGEIAGQFGVADHLAQVALYPRLVAPHQRRERRMIAPGGALYQTQFIRCGSLGYSHSVSRPVAHAFPVC